MASFKKYTKSSLQSNIDDLFCLVREYRNSESFRQMLSFCARFRSLSPYNAFLIEQQCPSARYVLTAEQWRKRYDRVPTANARPLIILIPFGPVSFVYEIADTQPSDPSAKSASSVDDILQQLEAPYQVKGDLPKGVLEQLISNLPYHSIAFDPNFRVGADYGAQIRWTDAEHKCKIKIQVNKESSITQEAKFLISVNSHADKATQFASICHELAHLFCNHLTSPFSSGWQTRKISHAGEEFEAETTSWLICERLNITNPSEQYLAQYLEANDTIPTDVSVDRIFFAANTILDMIEPMNVKDGLLYTFDSGFKSAVDDILAAKKRQKSKQLTLF
jgi:hypothetical protein